MKPRLTILLFLIYGSLSGGQNRPKINRSKPDIYESTYHQWRIVNGLSRSGQKLVSKEITHIENCKCKYN